MKQLGSLLILLVLAAVVFTVTRQETNSNAQIDQDLSDYRTTMLKMLGASRDSRQGNETAEGIALINQVGRSGDELYLAPLVDLAFFARANTSATDSAVYTALRQLSGEDFGNNWRSYLEWASENDIALPPNYDEFKGAFLGAFVDPEFLRFFEPGVQDNATVNMIEVVWGGVRVDGIPSLVNSPQISPEEATREGQEFNEFCRIDDCSYPAEDELVFGVSLNGDNRAYPLRLLNWHEMFNDVLGRTPMYDAPDGEEVCQFRAPTAFNAVAKQGDEWVKIAGVSAGCPESGWLNTEALEWDDSDWETVSALLPEDDELDAEEAPIGRVTGRPVMLAYCTLCGSGILYDVTIPDLVVNGESQGETVLEFGSTGLLMRSNKVMYDRNTQTAWNALTGRPAFGPLVESDLQLEILPVVVTDWQTWLEEHPDTSVLSLDTGFRRNYTNGAAYSDYFNDPDFIMFPVWQQDTEDQANKDVIFALNIDNTPKAYPLTSLIPEQVTNDTLADTNLVIITRETPERDFFEPGGAAVRAYRSGEFTFTPSENDGEVLDQDGTVWEITEGALISPDGEELPRVGGHLAFWFGWYSYNPDTLVYGME